MGNRIVRLGAAVLSVVTIAGGPGCATLAHRSSVSGDQVRHTSNCAGDGKTCPWIAADAALLLAGIVPGVVALAVDFGSGSWQHDNLDNQDSVSTHLVADRD